MLEKQKIKTEKRSYSDATLKELYGRAAGHCTLCNTPICYDMNTHQIFNIGQIAHIEAFSNKGPRSNLDLKAEEKNSIENLILLCGSCHLKIDNKKTEKLYTIEYLKNLKEEKEKQILQMMKALTPEQRHCIKCFGAINNESVNFSNNDLIKVCFNNQIRIHDNIIDLSLGNCKESVDNNINQLEENIIENYEIYVRNNKSDKKFCLFALAPQYLLIYLGYKLGDKRDFIVFTKYREKWVYNIEDKQQNGFKVKKPKIHDKNLVALVISCTTAIQYERIFKTLGYNIDIWEIQANEQGIDKINSINELQEFYTISYTTLDEIGKIYGKEKMIHIFPSMCNSLSIKLGQVLSNKSHNKVKIYDTIKDTNKEITEKAVLTL